MDIDAHLIHFRDPIFRADRKLWYVQFPHFGSERMPLPVTLNGLDEAGGCYMVVDVDDCHGLLSEL